VESERERVGKLLTWDVGVSAVYIGGSSGHYCYHRRVRARSRTEALAKCLAEIEEMSQTFPPNIKRISVEVGERYNPDSYAGRLSPMTVERNSQ